MGSFLSLILNHHFNVMFMIFENVFKHLIIKKYFVHFSVLSFYGLEHTTNPLFYKIMY
jgi:hypothetical protein